MRGKTRCRKHGGKSLSGAEHPNFKGGTSSVALPPRLAERVERHLADPELTATLRDIALASARLDELLDQFGTGEAADAWGAAAAAHRDITASAEDATPEGRARLADALARLDAAITQAQHERGLWAEVFDVQAHRARLVQTELKREERLEQNVTARQALTLLGTVKALLFEFVADPEARAEIAVRLEKLVSKKDVVPRQLTAGKKT